MAWKPRIWWKDWKFKTSLDYVVRPSLKRKKKSFSGVNRKYAQMNIIF